MGMYTELFLQVELREDTPEVVLNTLQYMGGTSEEEVDQPFDGERWRNMLKSNSHYHFPLSFFKLHKFNYVGGYYLFIRCDLKNYDSEIKKFLEWLAPHVEDTEGHYAGHYMYEEFENPTRIVFEAGKLVGG